MTDSTRDMDLGPVVAAARKDPAFLAGRISLAGAELVVAERLGLDQPRLQRLLLCRPPTPARFRTDVHAIAELVDVQPDGLAATLREVDAIAALRGAGELRLGDTGVVAAARQVQEEHVALTTKGSERLRELAREFWTAAPDRARHDRDVEAAIAWGARVAVVLLPRLSLAGVHGWLREHQVAVTGGPDDRALRGFLMAWRGVGVVFCDGTLEPGERRFTLAHEVGHFLLDYDQPRRRVLRNAPGLLEVVDGIRQPTASDRAQAMLAQVPLGVHTHLLDWDSGSGRGSEAEDEASRFAIELLAPWEEVLEVTRETATSTAPYEETLATSTQAIAERFALPPTAAHTRARQALDALSIFPRFFER